MGESDHWLWVPRRTSVESAILRRGRVLGVVVRISPHHHSSALRLLVAHRGSRFDFSPISSSFGESVV